jgi:LacI family transcriptional regulator
LTDPSFGCTVAVNVHGKLQITHALRSAMEGKKLTVKEIAAEAGVSIGTVDRVLHERGEVSEATRKRVLSIIERSGYKPNILAQRLSMGTSCAIRVVLPRRDQDSGYWGLCLDGIERASRELSGSGARIVVDEFDRYDEADCARAFRQAAEREADALLLAPVRPELLLAALGKLPAGRPYAFFDGELSGSSPAFTLGQDAYGGGRLAGRAMALLVRGKGRIVAIDAHAEDLHIGRRIEGFRDYLRESGVEAERRDCRALEDRGAREEFLEELFGRGDVAGILVANASGHLVGEWLAARGLKAGCALVSWDLVKANARALREGRIDCVVSQRPAAMAREALERLHSIAARGGEGAWRKSMPLELYLKENVPGGDEEDL